MYSNSGILNVILYVCTFGFICDFSYFQQELEMTAIHVLITEDGVEALASTMNTLTGIILMMCVDHFIAADPGEEGNPCMQRKTLFI